MSKQFIARDDKNLRSSTASIAHLEKKKEKNETSKVNWNVADAEKKKLYSTSRTELQTHIFNKTNKQACDKRKINTC